MVAKKNLTPRPEDADGTKNSVTRSAGGKMISKSTTKHSKKTKNKLLPEDKKKFANSLNLYVAEQKEKTPEKSRNQIMDQWKEVSEDEKKNYSDRAKEAREHIYGKSAGESGVTIRTHNSYSPVKRNTEVDLEADSGSKMMEGAE